MTGREPGAAGPTDCRAARLLFPGVNRCDLVDRTGSEPVTSSVSVQGQPEARGPDLATCSPGCASEAAGSRPPAGRVRGGHVQLVRRLREMDLGADFVWVYEALALDHAAEVVHDRD